VRVEVAEGDLLEQDVDAVVNAWNRNLVPWWLLIPQGVSGAIKSRGGFAPFRELGYRPLPLGTARHTSAGRLPFRGIIHVAAIDGLWRASEKSIRASVDSAVEIAEDHGYRSLALPALGAGSGGFDERAAIEIISEQLAAIDSVIRATVVRFRRGL